MSSRKIAMTKASRTTVQQSGYWQNSSESFTCPPLVVANINRDCRYGTAVPVSCCPDPTELVRCHTPLGHLRGPFDVHGMKAVIVTSTQRVRDALGKGIEAWVGTNG